ncbi:agamous-like MADS-box protein AGL61 [Rhodamnia argentea]|uniref:Agamous-like MADS-box protein AGL61 n=1 Tax=Rhodamnia argentea TaxID=178133 RepID=A0ABM3GVT5_9MYRT|nr:agamous-like MADS-box protein AGL61 [Rhodamnia argentea]
MKGETTRAKTMIEGAKARRVAFSKQRPGLLKKASELCTLCAVEMALILFSPSGQPFSFGHPSVGAILDRFEHPQTACPPATQQAQANGDQTLAELNKQYADVLEQLKAEKKRAKELRDVKPLEIQNLSFDQLMVLKKALADLKENVDQRRMELLALEAAAPTPCARAMDGSVIRRTDDKHSDPPKANAGEE